MSEFSDRPFIAGSLLGLRAFSVDTLGRLTGPARGGVFTPDENHAKCLRSPYDEVTVAMRSLTTTLGRRSTRGHSLAGVDCTCGYYAYFDGGNDYAPSGLYGTSDRISALIEGYGVCTVGSRGFRAEKARLVALVIPDGRGHRMHPQWYDRLADACYGKEWPSLVSVLGGIVGSFLTVFGILAGIAESPWLLAVLPVSLSLLTVGVTLFKADFHGIDRRYADVNKKKTERCHDLPDRRSVNYDLVRSNYPDVPVFPTVAAALAEYRLTVPETPTPQSDTEFWTRNAR